TPAALVSPPPTGRLLGSPLPTKLSSSCRTAATPSSRTCVRQYLLRSRSATRLTVSAAWTMVSSKHAPSTACAPAPPPRQTPVATFGSPRKPTLTPPGKPPAPKPSTTTPPRSALPPSPHSWPPNASASKPATPDTSNGPQTPALPGTQPGRPQPNCNDEGTPNQRAIHRCDRKANHSR